MSIISRFDLTLHVTVRGTSLMPAMSLKKCRQDGMRWVRSG
jgi:hypothetical protein